MSYSYQSKPPKTNGSSGKALAASRPAGAFSCICISRDIFCFVPASCDFFYIQPHLCMYSSHFSAITAFFRPDRRDNPAVQNCCVPGTTMLQGPQSWYRETGYKTGKLFHIRVMPKPRDILNMFKPGSLRSAHGLSTPRNYRYPNRPGVLHISATLFL